MRILVAIGHAWQRSALRLLLDNTPDINVVGEVTDVDQVYDAAANLQPDVIVLDWILPGLKSTRARRHLVTSLHALHPNVNILVLLGSDVATGLQKAMGADAYVSKSQPPDRLLIALQRVATDRETGSITHQFAQQGEEF